MSERIKGRGKAITMSNAARSKKATEDMEEIVCDDNIPWQDIANSTVLVTGATGLIGSALVRALFAANAKHSLNIKTIAHGRDEKKLKQHSEEYGAICYNQDISEQFKLKESIDYIFHCVAVTSSQEMVTDPIGVIKTSLNGITNVLSLANEKQIKSMVYLSSMEVYGLTDHSLAFVNENDLGFIDLSNPRSCYPESKRMCELVCNCSVLQYGASVKIARLAQTFGAGTPKDDTRVFAQFARSAVAGEKIVLHTEGASRGNYCYIADTVRGLFYILLKGKSGEAYNVANPVASVTIREMAEIVATDVAKEVCGRKTSVIVNVPENIDKRGYAPDTAMRISADKLKLLGWKPKHGLAEMYLRMIADWHSTT